MVRRNGAPSGCLPSVVVLPLRAARRVVMGRARVREEIGRGVALRGRVWNGIADLPFEGVVVIGMDGRVAAVGPQDSVVLPDGLRVIDCVWIGPGVTDAHVHLAATATSGHDELRAGLVAVRDLGSPVERLAHWRVAAPLVVVGAGPAVVGAPDPPPHPDPHGDRTDLDQDVRGGDVRGGDVRGRDAAGSPRGRRLALRRAPAGRMSGGDQMTADGRTPDGLTPGRLNGEPGRPGGARTGRGGSDREESGRDPFNGDGQAVVDSPARARRAVTSLAADGVDLIKVCLGGGEGTAPSRRSPLPYSELAVVVQAAHAAGLPVTAHALTVTAVELALRAGVDELAHVPLELLPPETVGRIAAAGVPVVSTLQCHSGAGPAPGRNAALLHRAGVPLIYGTDAGGAGNRPPGVDPRELDRLAYAGLGRLGALRASTSGSARAAGFDGQRPSGRIEVGGYAAVVGLPADPLVEPAAWRHPTVVVNGQRIITA
ncbi:amidohydrolase family protein [Frankia sp. Cr2]|uniref:amidohydrolase family protein n=1 Tax=Frankia sp. Cr2 TaxID=3073932 RepID=UPI002AD20394|nr:amidohydrolase family protein [Frankia sp. Cr2]